MNRRNGTLLAAILGSSVVFLDSTVVNVALQRIGQDLPSTFFGVLEGQSYIYNGYLLTLSALLILAGALADAFGRRKLFAIGLAAFGLTSMLCGLAPTMEFLIAGRLLQGAAGALLVPGSIALITTTFEGEERGHAFGLWGAASAVTSLVGPFVGGMLVETVSWRAVFYLNVPLIAVALWATWRFVEESRDPQAGRRFDWLGAAVAAIAVGGLAFGAIYGQEHNWSNAVGPVALAVGAVASVAFVVLMAVRPHPLVPLGLFRSRNFAVVNLTTFLIYGALYVSGYFQAIFSQGTIGYSAAAAGLMTVPGGLMIVLLSSRFGTLGARFGPRRFMAAGPALMAIGMLWYLRIPANSEPWAFQAGSPSSWLPPASYFVDFLPVGILFGLGLAMLIAPLTTALMTSVPGSRAGLGSAINNAVSRVGPQLAGALIFVALTAAFYANLSSRVPGVDVSSSSFRRDVSPLNRPAATVPAPVAAAAHDASVDSFRLAMGLTAVLLLAGAAINAAGISDAQAAAGSGQPHPAGGKAAQGSDEDAAREAAFAG